MNTRNASLEALEGAANDLWLGLVASNGDVAEAADRAGVDRSGAEATVKAWLAKGLVDKVAEPGPWEPPFHVVSKPSWGTRETRVRLAPPLASSRRWRVPAAAALCIALIGRQTARRKNRFLRMTWLATVSTRRVRPANQREAEQAIRAVRWVGRFVPARVACLEESVATLLTLAMMGCHATWCHGVDIDPLQFHAWVEAEGSPVDEPVSTSNFIPITRIPAARSENGAHA
ncbi:lasso peptide biosynthesis B2 protein [Kitasatospora sp. NPDC093550]|uniref:lasso peptide biosynthesis B2 protein n=1 Tax=Kitasatospora sp. NPDC093550 TaxID=3364089 RepID=UPI00381C793E